MHVVPTPCLVAKSSITVKDAIEQMRMAKTSYIILTDEEEFITGIFTERDVFKYFDQFLDIRNLEKPILQFMTKPIKTVTLALIHTAPEYMVNFGIRHVPVVHINHQTNKEELIGIVTADVIFESMVKGRALPQIFGGETHRGVRKKIGVISPDGVTYDIFKRVFHDSKHVEIVRKKFLELQRPEDIIKVKKEYNAIILDVDDLAPRLWTPIVRSIFELPTFEAVCLTYTPKKNEGIKNFFESLTSRAPFLIYEKPIDISELITDLERIWPK